MAFDRKEIDLIIKAQLQGGKSLDNVIKSIHELEAALDDQTAAAKRGEGSIDDLKATLIGLKQAQDRLGQQADLIGNFNKLTDAVKKSGDAADAAVVKYDQYKAKVDATGNVTEAQAVSLGRLASAVTRTQSTLDKQKATLSQLQSTLTEAGVDTNNLAIAQDKLRKSSADLGVNINRADVAISNFARDAKVAKAAQKELTDEQERSGKAFNLFNNNGRTTLSLLQRIRGEVLGLAGAYIGLYAAINGIKDITEAANVRQAAFNQLTLANGGDKVEAGKDLEYIAQQAERLGVNLESATKGYAKFAASAQLAGRNKQETRFLFESVSEIGRVAGLTTEQLEGTFFALSQIDSKGRVMAEEFNGQLGDRLPGLTGIAKEATSGIFKDFNAAMKDGKVSIEILVDIFEKYRDKIQNTLPAATESFVAKQERLNNSIFNFKLAVADSGFIDTFAKLIVKVTEFFNSQDGKNFATNIGAALTTAVDIIRLLLDHLDEVKLAFQLFTTIYFARQIAIAGGALADFIIFVRALNVQAGLLSGTLLFLTRAFIGLNALLIGFELGGYLTKFESFRVVFINLAALIESGSIRIAAAFKLTRLVVDNFFTSLTPKNKAAIDNQVEAIIKEKERQLKALADAVQTAYYPDRNNTAKIKPRVELVTEKPTPSGTTASKTDAEIAKEEKAAAKRLATKTALENAIAAIEAKSAKKEKDDLESRLSGIDIQYTALLNKVRKFGGAESGALETRLNAAVADAKAKEIEDFNAKLLTEQRSLQTKIEALEASGDAKNKQNLDSRLAAVTKRYEETYRDIADLRNKLVSNGRDTAEADAFKGRLDAGVLELQNAERKQFFLDAIAQREKQINDIISERTDRIKTLNIEQKAGLITDSQVREGAKAIIEDTQPRLEALTAEAHAFAEANKEALDPAAFAAFIAKIEEARVSASGLKTELFTAISLSEMIANGATTAFNTVSQALGNLVAGVGTFGDVIDAARNAFLKFAADFLLQIAEMILKQALLNALQSSSGEGGILGTIAGALSGLVLHEGGVVGSGGVPTRSANSAWFANAPRYHTGGIAGLSPDEYPAILKKNEEVLTQSDPRNVLNGGGQGGSSSSPANIKIVNMIDSGSVISEGLSSQEGSQSFLNFIYANRSAVKAAIS